jgi:hypothetical protein
MVKDTETDKGKESITPPAPKKSFLDRASNQLARTIGYAHHMSNELEKTGTSRVEGMLVAAKKN